jgi:hypothetical protein
MKMRKTVKMNIDNNDNETIAKSDKGSSVVILKIQDYTDKIANCINDNHVA